MCIRDRVFCFGRACFQNHHRRLRRVRVYRKLCIRDRSLRRRPLYPTELRGLIQKIFTFTGLQDSNDSIFRRRSLYTTELRGHMGDIQTVRCTVGFLPGYTRFFYFTCFSSPCQSGGGPPQKNREPLKQRLPAEGAFAAYSITRTRMTLGKCLTSSMTLSATLEPRSTMV